MNIDLEDYPQKRIPPAILPYDRAGLISKDNYHSIYLSANTMHTGCIISQIMHRIDTQN